MSSPGATAPPLQAVLDAFNAHDVDAIMSFFTDDCVFDTPRGPAPGGHRLVGKEQVRKGFQARFDGIPDIAYADDRHWSCGDRGVSEWTIRGTQDPERGGPVCSLTHLRQMKRASDRPRDAVDLAELDELHGRE